MKIDGEWISRAKVSFWFALGHLDATEAPSKRRRRVTWSSSLSMSRNVRLWQDAAIPLALVLIRFWLKLHDFSASWGLSGCCLASRIPDNHRRSREPESPSGSAQWALTEHPLHTEVQVSDSVALIQSLSDYVWYAYLCPSWRHSHEQHSQIFPPKHSSSTLC